MSIDELRTITHQNYQHVEDWIATENNASGVGSITYIPDYQITANTTTYWQGATIGTDSCTISYPTITTWPNTIYTYPTYLYPTKADKFCDWLRGYLDAKGNKLTQADVRRIREEME